MKCPYNILDVMQTNTDRYTYNELGNCTMHTHQLIEQRDLMDCLREECAAWQDGRCQYRGAVS